MDLFLPFNSIDGDRRHPAEDLAAMIAALYSNGVHPAPEGSLFVRAAGGWNVQIQPGKCLIQGRIGINNSSKSLTIAPPHGVFDRIDRVVLRCDFGARAILEAVRTGAPASNPTAPALQRDADAYEICLAQITVGRGATQIRQMDIQDIRSTESLCGFIHALFPIETEAVFARFSSLYDEYRKSIESQYSEYSRLVDGRSSDALTVFDLFAAAINTLKIDAYDQVGLWFNPFKAGTVEMVSAWFADYTSTLGPDEAVQLFNKLYAHEQAHAATDDEGAHGLRYSGGKLQALVPGGWVTLAQVVLGYRWSYRDALNLTWAEWDTLNPTWAEYDNLIEMEAE